MSILPARMLIKVTKGTTYDYSFQWMVGEPSGATPTNLTGYTAAWTIVPYGGFASMHYTTTLNGNGSGVIFGGSPTDLTTGIIDLVISATDTAAINWLTGSYSLALFAPASGPVTQLLTGSIAVIGALPS